MAVPATRLLVLHPELRAASDLLLYARRWMQVPAGEDETRETGPRSGACDAHAMHRTLVVRLPAAGGVRRRTRSAQSRQ